MNEKPRQTSLEEPPEGHVENNKLWYVLAAILLGATMAAPLLAPTYCKYIAPLLNAACK